MNINEKTNFYIDIINRIALNSECKSRKVGAIIVFDDRIISEGWNSPPPKCLTNECLKCGGNNKSGKNLELALCTHAEINAISSAAYLGFSIKTADIYCTTKPCSECAKAIAACGIKKVHYVEDYDSEYTDYIFIKNNIEIIKILKT
jgi:dCMP deaminase